MKKTRLLLREEEQELARKWRNEGDLSARGKLVCAFKPMVVKMARQMARSGADIEDLISEGMTGLLVAVDDFDPEAGNRFCSFARWKVLHQMQVHTTKAANIVDVRTSGPERQAMRMLLQARKVLFGSEVNEQVFQLVSEFSNVSVERVRMLYSALNSQGSSLNTPVAAEGVGGELGDLIADEAPDRAFACEMNRQQSSVILDALGALSDPRGAQIISQRFLSDEAVNAKDIAEKLSLCPTRIYQIERKSLEEMRNWMKEHGFKAEELLTSSA